MAYAIYNLVLIVLFIVFSPLILAALLWKKKFRAGFFEKCGLFSRFKKDLFEQLERPIWFHTVSVGEFLAAQGLIKKFMEENPAQQVVISTVTLTGQTLAQQKLGDRATVFYFPFDIGFIVDSVITVINPKLVVILETEIWPNFSHGLNKKNIPLMTVNGRISPNSYKNYYRFRWILTHVLRNFTVFLMQSEMDADRIKSIGAKEECVKVVGNLKYDITPQLDSEEVDKLKASLWLNPGEQVIIAGSTHHGEEESVLKAYLALREEIPGLKLILAPRHPERHKEVIDLAESAGVKMAYRSRKESFKESSVLFLDTMGELGQFYSLADVAFVGGSLLPKGGHNPLEPAVYQVPTVVGPHTFNFKDITAYMVTLGAVIQTEGEKDLKDMFRTLLLDRDVYEKARSACLKVFEQNRGATDKVLLEIHVLINRD